MVEELKRDLKAASAEQEALAAKERSAAMVEKNAETGGDEVMDKGSADVAAENE